MRLLDLKVDLCSVERSDGGFGQRTGRRAGNQAGHHDVPVVKVGGPNRRHRFRRLSIVRRHFCDGGKDFLEFCVCLCLLHLHYNYILTNAKEKERSNNQ